MAIAKVADRGSQADNAAGTSHLCDLAAGGSITVGNYLIARVTAENTGGGGAARTLTITDPRSNTWTKLPTAGINRDPGGAGEGTTTWLCYAKVANAYSNGDDITFGLSGSARLAVCVEEWSGIHLTSPIAASEVTGSGVSPASILITPTAAGQLVYACHGWEGPSSDTFSGDGDSLQGSWVTLTKVGTSNATETDNETVCGQYKLVTGTSQQDYSGGPNSRDWAAVLVVFAEEPAVRPGRGRRSLQAVHRSASWVI